MHKNRNKRSPVAAFSLVALCVSTGAFAAPPKDRSHQKKTESPGAQNGTSEDEIVVTGLRASIQTAVQAKRNAPSVIEAITPEDLGKFSDANIADALQRVPGVQISRNDDERSGDQISIRGLGPQFSTTTINGRNAFSGGTEGLKDLRSFSLDVIPTQIVNSIIVRKTPTAENIESGIAGQVDIQTLVPLEAPALRRGRQSLYASVTADAVKNSLSNKTGKRFNGIVGGKTANGTIGWYVAGLYSKSFDAIDGAETVPSFLNLNVDKNRNGQLDPGETISNVRVPTNNSLDPERTASKRIAAAGALQWKPSNSFDAVADFIYSDYERKDPRSTTSPNLLPALGANGSTTTALFDPSKIQIAQDAAGQSYVKYMDLSGISFPGVGGSFDALGCARGDTLQIVGCPRSLEINHVMLQYNNHTKVKSGGIKLHWRPSDTWDIKSDIYYSGNTFQNDLYLTTINTRVAGGIVDLTKIGHLDLNYNEGDPRANPYLNWGFAVRLKQASKTNQTGLALDLKYLPESSFVKSIDFGGRYTIANFSQAQYLSIPFGGNRFPSQGNNLILNAAFTGNFLPFNAQPGFNPNKLPEINIPGIIAAFQQAADLGNRPGDTSTVPAYTFADKYLFLSPSSTYGLQDKALAGYVQVNLVGRIGADMPLTGNVGVRLVKHNYNANGPSLVNGQPGTIIGSPGLDILPSANFNIKMNDSTYLRFGAARTVSQPEIEDLVRPLSVDPLVCPTCNGIRTGRSGNINLKPLSAWTLDSTLEWYNKTGGSVVASVFFKSINNFIIDNLTELTLPLPEGGTGSVRVNAPVNFSNGDAEGFEVGFQQPLTFLPTPFDGLGVQANYTRVYSHFDKSVGNGGLGWPGSSKNNYNAMVYYSKRGLDVRLAYAYRDDFITSINTAQLSVGADQVRKTAGWGQLSLSASYEVNKHLSVHGEVSDVSKSHRFDYVGFRENWRAVYQRGRTVSVGLTMKP